jgi:hypothetical protein
VIPDIEPTGFLTWLTTWQLQVMASDQTSLFTSLIGNSINASINNYMVAMTSPKALEVTPTEATLSGLSNSISAMVDDMLVSYASAQLMVANDTQTTSVTITIKALQLEEKKYIIIVYDPQRHHHSVGGRRSSQDSWVERAYGFQLHESKESSSWKLKGWQRTCGSCGYCSQYGEGA